MTKCPTTSDADQSAPLIGTLTFHTLMTYITLGTGICSCLICCVLSIAHLSRYTRPREQKQLIRIIWTPAVFAFFSFFGVWRYNLAYYLAPLNRLYEAFALIAVFYLLVALVAPSTFRDQLAYFSTHPKDDVVTQISDLQWFQSTYYMVVQILPTRILTVAISEIIEATHCHGTTAYHRAHTIISVVQGFFTALCIMALLKFYLRFRTAFHTADPAIVARIGLFKLIVLLNLVQTIVLSILAQHNALKSTRFLSYNDLNLGLNALVTALEAFIFALLFVWPFWPRHHHHQQQRSADHEKEPFCAASLDAVDVTDVIAGIYRAIVLFRGRLPSSSSESARVSSPNYTYNQNEYDDRQRHIRRDSKVMEVSGYQ